MKRRAKLLKTGLRSYPTSKDERRVIDQDDSLIILGINVASLTAVLVVSEALAHA